jgi:hypothetical protein
MTPEEKGKVGQSTPRHRSPNYPGVSLKTAIDKITPWYKADGVVASPVNAAARHMGFEKYTSDTGRLLSALKSYGLAVETDGRLKLTPRAIDIVARPADDPKHKQAIREALAGPAIYRELLKEYPNGQVSDTTLESELIANKGFNPKSVPWFIKDFRATLNYAGITPATVIDSSETDETPDDEVQVHAGDYVQWESNGLLQFTAPRRVTGFSEDGDFAFVEGSGTGLPVKELTVEQPPAPPPPPPAGQLTPEQQRAQFLKPPPPPAQGIRQDVFSLGEGTVTIQWPASLSPESFEDLSGWLDILKRKIGRSVPFRATKRDIIAKLKAGFKIDGDPESDTPCGLIDPSVTGIHSVPLIPAEMLRDLIEDGIVEDNPGTGRRTFKMA